LPKAKYPAPEVKTGEVWRCGGHAYMCSDLMEADPTGNRSHLADGSFPGWPRPTLVYTDPPWGQALANGFRTKAGLDRAGYDWTDIYRSISTAAFLLGIPAWFEGPEASTRDGLKVPAAIMDGPGHRLYRRISYFGGNPSGLYYASPAIAPPRLELVSTEGFAVVRQVLECYPPGVLLDPCSGLGGIPLVGERLGWMSVSNELNPARMGRALARMADATGATPERIA